MVLHIGLFNHPVEQSNRQKEIEYYQQKKLVLLCDLDNTLIDVVATFSSHFI